MSDSVVRSGRRESFTVLYNSMITDKRLSLKAKGLFAVMMSRPEGWEFSVSGLAAFTGVGKDSIRNTLAELEKVGYLVREQAHQENGTFGGNIYILQDMAPPSSGKPDNGEIPLSGNTDDGENRQRETPSAGFPPQQNIDLTEERLEEPPKAPQRGKRTSKYDLAEDAKPVLRAYCTNYPELYRPLADLIEIRVAKKAINSKRAIVTLLNEIDRLSDGRREDKLLLVRQSVANSWKSVFPLKGGGAPAPAAPVSPERFGWD